MIGVYAFIPKGQLGVQYIGHSKNVQKRITEHFRNQFGFTKMAKVEMKMTLHTVQSVQCNLWKESFGQ